jgi:lipid-binding SYLF domain-containing protein
LDGGTALKHGGRDHEARRVLSRHRTVTRAWGSWKGLHLDAGARRPSQRRHGGGARGGTCNSGSRCVDAVTLDKRSSQSKETVMFRKTGAISLAALLVLIAGASVVARADSKREIDVSVTEALRKFTDANPAHNELLHKAVGVLVFPHVTKAGAGIAGEHGDGALLRNGKTVHYYSLTSASVGLTLGAGQRTEVLLFMTKEALSKFEASKGFNLGVDAQVAMVSKGAGGNYDSETLKKPILGFVFDEKGLLGDISLKGSKIKKIEPT